MENEATQAQELLAQLTAKVERLQATPEKKLDWRHHGELARIKNQLADLLN